MNNYSWEYNLENLLVNLMEGEKIIENLRISLCEIYNFSIKTIFRKMDVENKGKLSADNIKQFLNNNSLQLKDHLIMIFLNYYQGHNILNKSQSQEMYKSLSFNNFKLFLISKLDAYLTEEVLRRDFVDRNENNFDKNTISTFFDVDNLMAELIKEEILLIERVESILDEFFIDDSFSCKLIIKRLDLTYKNYIDEIDLEEFFREKKYNYNRFDCKLILHRLDRDYDTNISYDDIKFLFKTHLKIERNRVGRMKIFDKSNNSHEIVPKSKNKKIEKVNAHNKPNFTTSSFNQPETSKIKKILKINSSFNLENFFFEILKSDLKIEDLKNTLAISKDIIILELFYLFDLNNTNNINKKVFQKSLKKFNIFPTDQDIELIYRRYDSDSDAHLDFDEFLDIFLPINPEYCKMMKNRMNDINENQISNQSKFNLIRFFKMIIDNEIKIESNRKLLCSQLGFSAYEEFRKIKSTYMNKADIESLKEYLNNYSCLYPSDFNLILRRFDKDKDGKISFDDFVDEITPRNLMFDA